tara:strand:- start:1570 stop:1698 length:129 start_codon:yes stop_codon:yes gene_type:complete
MIENPAELKLEDIIQFQFNAKCNEVASQFVDHFDSGFKNQPV